MWREYIDRKKFAYLDFLRELIAELAEDEQAKQRNSISLNATSSNTKTLKTWEKDESRLIGVHMPIINRDPQYETLNKEENTLVLRNYKRGRCFLCRTNVSLKCFQCKVYLCCDVNGNDGVSCWQKFHFHPKLTPD